MNSYLGIIGFVGVPTVDGRTLPSFTTRDFPLPVYSLGEKDYEFGEDKVIGKLTASWLDDFGRIWAQAEIESDQQLLTGGMDMDLPGPDVFRLMAFTVYVDDDGATAPAWPGVHLLMVAA